MGPNINYIYTGGSDKRIKLPPETLAKIRQGAPFEGKRIYDVMVDKGALDDPEALLGRKDRSVLLKLFSAHLNLTKQQSETINSQSRSFISTAEKDMLEIVNLKANGCTSNPRARQYIVFAANNQYEMFINGLGDAYAIVAVANAIADQFRHFDVATRLANIYLSGSAGDFPQN
jgi:hypothetical protein